MTITWNTGSAATRFRSTRKKIEENRKRNKAASSQAGGPAHKEPGAKHKTLLGLTIYKL